MKTSDLEACQSGRMGLPAKELTPCGVRRFKSSRLRGYHTPDCLPQSGVFVYIGMVSRAVIPRVLVGTPCAVLYVTQTVITRQIPVYGPVHSS